MTGLQDYGRSFRSKFLALSFDFFTQLHEVPMSIASSPSSSDGSFIIVPQKLGNFWLFDEDMVENESPILKQIQHKPISFTSCTLRQTAAQGMRKQVGTSSASRPHHLYLTPCECITFQQALYQTNGITFHNPTPHCLCNACVI